MNILICEDEGPASKQLTKLIGEIHKKANIIDVVETGEEALEAIERYKLDLIFMDVELADGSCFDTLDNVEIEVPVIFTTAYDEYALKAFKMNSIDYLLKPISKSDIVKAFSKYEKMKQSISDDATFTFSRDLFTDVNYKDRFLVKLGRKLFPINTDEIAYFMARDKLVWLVTNQFKKYVINYTLADLEEMLNPEVFFRLNRQFISHIDSIKELEPYFKGQVTVNLTPSPNEEIIVSRSKTPELKEWLGV